VKGSGGIPWSRTTAPSGGFERPTLAPSRWGVSRFWQFVGRPPRGVVDERYEPKAGTGDDATPRSRPEAGTVLFAGSEGGR
jgi:hypothetical protein